MIVAIGGDRYPQRSAAVGGSLAGMAVIGSTIYPPAMGFLSVTVGLTVAMFGNALLALACVLALVAFGRATRERAGTEPGGDLSPHAAPRVGVVVPDPNLRPGQGGTRRASRRGRLGAGGRHRSRQPRSPSLRETGLRVVAVAVHEDAQLLGIAESYAVEDAQGSAVADGRADPDHALTEIDLGMSGRMRQQHERFLLPRPPSRT